MTYKKFAAWLGVLLLATGSAHAGLVGAHSADAPSSAVRTANDLAPQLPFTPVLFEPRDLTNTIVPEVAGDFDSDSEGSQLTTLPPAPDSAVLALSGLLSLGAVQLGRSVRKIHLGALPEWYHDGAVQVGHSTPFDLDLGFTQAALPVCAFTRPAERKGPILFGAQWPDPDRCAPQFSPTRESPRAPPNLL